MKFLERFALVVYSYIIILLAVVLCLLVFNWISIETIEQILNTVVTGEITSKITLGVSTILVLISLKCIFFDEASKEKMKDAQGILLKNENGELIISKESIDNMVKNAVSEFEDVKQCNTKIHLNSENKIMITLNIEVQENVIIKDLATNLQNKVKENIKNISDLEVAEVNVKLIKIQEEKKNKENKE